ncbi:hypothetical protein [Rubellimicrobium arenae]|uniref:hypothetical protein n=1 Tax=Rubellimicrobium arenae TaxID=2817372 RepID=UPI001B314A1A|nr:hypothetical protein [Rubellimicrobium arenae]
MTMQRIGRRSALDGQTVLAWAGLPALAFLFGAACSSLPVLAHRYLPMVDLPNHIARLHIAATEGGPLSRYYEYGSALLPNSAADLLWMLAPQGMDPVRFSQVIMAICPMAYIAATMVLSRVAQQQWSLWPAVSALFAYNAPFRWGFENYSLSVPFALLALALWLRLESRGPLFRILLFTPITLGLYLLHLFAFVVLAVAVLGREVQILLGSRQDWRQVGRGLLLALPFLPPLGWYVFDALSAVASPLGHQTIFGLRARVAVLTSPFVASTGDMGSLVNLAGAGALILTLFFGLTAFRRNGPRLIFQGPLTGSIVALAIASALTPAWLNGVALVHIRLPLVTLAVAVAGTTWRSLDIGTAKRWAMIVACLLLARGVAFERLASSYDAEIQDLMTVLAQVPVGSPVMPARAPGQEGDRGRWHLPAYAVVTRDAFVPTLFQGSHALRVRPDWIPFSHPSLYPPSVRRLLDNGPQADNGRWAFLRNWTSRFPYLLVLDPWTAGPGSGLQLVTRAGRFSLYQVTEAPPEPEAPRPPSESSSG